MLRRSLLDSTLAVVLLPGVLTLQACGSARAPSNAVESDASTSSDARSIDDARSGAPSRDAGSCTGPECENACDAPHVPCNEGCCLPAGQCSNDGWCWENPRPQGNAIRAIYARAKNDVWIVGSGGLAMHWDGRSWTRTPTGTIDAFHGVIGFASGEVFAVATDGLQGHVRKWNGSTWDALPVPSVVASWRATWGAAANDFWIFGTSGNAAHAAHWTGASWSSYDLPLGARVYSAWGSDPAHVWSVGDFGGGAPAINRWNGSSFASDSMPSTISLMSAWGFAESDRWTSHIGGASHWNGSSWTTHALGKQTDSWMSIWGASSSDAWTASYGAGVAHWDGSKFDFDATAGERYLLALAGSGADDVWAGGLGGTLLRRNASVSTAWRPLFDAVTPWLTDVSGTSATDLWAVGSALHPRHGPPVIAHGDGTTWKLAKLPSAVATDDAAFLTGVWSVSATDAWAVGEKQAASFALRWNGTAWTDGGAIPIAQVNDVWGDASALHAVGGSTKGEIASWSGSSWTTTSCGAGPLRAVHGAAANDVWAVGFAGAVCHFDGSTWTLFTTPLGASAFASVWTGGSNEAWAGTFDGAILRWAGASWTVAYRYQQGKNFTVGGLWSDAPGSVYASAGIPYFQDHADGYGSAILHLSDGVWGPQESGTNHFLSSLWGVGANVWTVGAFGTMLRHE